MKRQGYCCMATGILAAALIALSASARAQPLDSPYADTEWPTLHRDRHNSDFLPTTLGAFDESTTISGVAWLLREADMPACAMTGGVVGEEDGEPVFYVTTGKVRGPNLHAFRLSDGQRIWQSAPPNATLDPGPDSLVLTCAPLLDETGDMFLADSRYLYCYSIHDSNNAQGYRPPKWKRVLPHLLTYSSGDGLWHPTDDPTSGTVFARPMLSMFFINTGSGTSHVAGVTVDGEILIFDRETGALFERGDLRAPDPGSIFDLGEPCDPDYYASIDNPMYWNPSEESTDTLTMFGVWCTGVQPETDDPDLDYFMNPCQISAYLAAGTFGSGQMVSNFPATFPDPSSPTVSRIYICGEQSQLLAEYDLSTRTADSMLYRVDVDVAATTGSRIRVLNHEFDADIPAYRGRMANGKNSATSPDVSPDRKWIYVGDQQGHLYCFDAEDGTLNWMAPIGDMYGSPTTIQETDLDGYRYLYAFGSHKLWAISIDPDTGEIPEDAATRAPRMRALDFRDYLTSNCWRTEPGYDTVFYNALDNPYERHALSASIITATRDKLICIYTIGWHDPNFPDIAVIPTHSVEVIIDRSKIFATTDPAEYIEATYIDVGGSSEVGCLLSNRFKDRGIIIYGSQSTTMSRYMEINDMMPEGMKSLYLKPWGGIRIVELPLLAPPATAPNWKLY